MPFQLPDGRTLALDTPFTLNEVQYPANWLRLSSPEERAALGITETPEPEWYDQRFYWDVGNPKDHTQLVDQWIGQVKVTAASLLAATDWMITRASDPSSAKPVPQDVLDRRTEIRQFSNEKEVALLATASTDELAAYVTSAEFSQWEPAPVVPEEGGIPVDGTTGDVVFG